MWPWMLAGWLVAAAAVAALHHRWRRTGLPLLPEAEAFLLRFETQVATSHPDVECLGTLPHRFACLLRVDGQETVVPLHDLFRLAHVPPDAFARHVAALIAEVREQGLDRVGDLDFAAAAPSLLPQVRTWSWLEQHGSFGGSGLVHTRLDDELVVVYVLDADDDMVFVCREHLRRWRKEVADVHNLAVANLARRGDVPSAQARRGPLIVRSGDGFDAARVLLLGRADADGLLVAIPDRDTLWIGPEQGQDLAQLMAQTEELSQRSTHPVSPRVYRVTDGRIAALPR